MENEEATYPISAVSDLTGLSAHVVRAWEKRYSAVCPQRTESGHRLYSREDIARLRLLRRATECGMSIGAVARMETDQLARLMDETPEPGAPAGGLGQDVSREDTGAVLERCKAAILALDGPALEAALQEAAMDAPPLPLTMELVAPLLRWVGDSWEQGAVRVALEHLASSIIEAFLQGVRGSYAGAAEAPALIATTPSGEHHGFGALMAAAVAAAEGWKTTYLGTNLPAAEIAHVAKAADARAVVLSLVYPLSDPRMVQQLAALGRLLPPDIFVVVGGRVAYSYDAVLRQVGAFHAQELTDLRDLLPRTLKLTARPGT